ncbi:MAG: hypothetical protein ACP5K1_04430, partial [Candidatus Bathyarchaeia archaeon]
MKAESYMSGVAAHKVVGWILDVYMEGDKAILWIKAEDGETLHLTDGYEAEFYIRPRLRSVDHRDIEELAYLIQTHPNVTRVERGKRRISLSMEEHEVLHVYVDSIRNYGRVIRDIRSLNRIDSYYNTDLLHVQKYLFRMGLPPTCKAEVSYTRNGEVASLTILDDGREVKPPPFKVLIFDIYPSAPADPRHDGGRNQISGILLKDEHEGVKLFKGGEEEVIAAFQECIRCLDPDLLVSENVEEKASRLLRRAGEIGLNLQLGRLKSHYHGGRVLLDLRVFLELGLAGIVERCRFA